MITRRQAVFVLNLIAGWIDGVGFLALVGTVQAFPSYMSGNSTKIVTDAVSGKFGLAAAIGGVVLAFIFGAIVARLLNDGSKRRETAALLAVAIGIWIASAGAGAGWSKDKLLLALAFTMGMINRSLQGRNGYTVHPFLSGAVVAIGSDIADAISGRGPWSQVLLPLSIWGAVLVGAAAGSLVVINFGLVGALFVPALAVTGLALANGFGWLQPAADPHDGHPTSIEMQS